MKDSAQSKQNISQEQIQSKQQAYTDQYQLQEFLKLNMHNSSDSSQKEENYTFMYDCLKQSDLTNMYYQQQLEPIPYYISPWELNILHTVNQVILNPNSPLKDCVEHYQTFINEVQQFKDRVQAKYPPNSEQQIEAVATDQRQTEMQFSTFLQRIDQYGLEYPIVQVYKGLIQKIQQLLREYQEHRVDQIRCTFYECDQFVHIAQVFINIAVIQLQQFYKLLNTNFAAFKKNIGAAPKLASADKEKIDKGRWSFFLKEIKKVQQPLHDSSNKGFKRGLSFVAKLTQQPELTDLLYNHVPLFKEDNLDLGQNVLTREFSVQGMQTQGGKIPKGSIFLAVPYIVYTQYPQFWAKYQDTEVNNNSEEIKTIPKTEQNSETTILRLLQSDNGQSKDMSLYNMRYIQVQQQICYAKDKQNITTFQSSIEFIKTMLQTHDYVIYTCDKGDMLSPFIRNKQFDLTTECYNKVVDYTNNTVTMLFIKTETYLTLYNVNKKQQAQNLNH